jgi:peptidoglycan/LPS O-acetylase OafA/YrhL
LAVEEHFYLFWPLIIYYFDNKKVVLTILLLLVIALLTRFYLNSQSIEVFYFTFSRIDELVFGALLALMEQKNLLLSKYAKRYFILFIISSIPAILLWILFNGTSNSVVQVIKFPFLAINYFALVAFVISISKQNIITKILTTRFFSYTGKISYGLYVYHPLCFLILTFKFHTGNYFITFLMAFIVTYLIASISYYGFESKFLKLKSRFSS